MLQYSDISLQRWNSVPGAWPSRCLISLFTCKTESNKRWSKNVVTVATKKRTLFHTDYIVSQKFCWIILGGLQFGKTGPKNSLIVLGFGRDKNPVGNTVRVVHLLLCRVCALTDLSLQHPLLLCLLSCSWSQGHQQQLCLDWGREPPNQHTHPIFPGLSFLYLS